uniref:Uncharacterized protein n=1 Tax=Spongospora subterranea TaxID=70186 RepID=A0A0H5R4P1_9EUKA|eukprot:CRZ09165.1 hypothetical protein [Spongospora subterranea]
MHPAEPSNISQQLLHHTLDASLWSRHQEIEDEFYSSIGHSFDYQPDLVSAIPIERGIGFDPNLIEEGTPGIAAKHDVRMKPELTAINEVHNNTEVTAGLKTLPAAQHDEDEVERCFTGDKRGNSDDINMAMNSCLSAKAYWSQTIAEGDRHFSTLQEEIQKGLQEMQDIVQALNQLYVETVPRMVEQLRVKAQTAIEEGEAKIAVSSKLCKTLQEANNIAKSFEVNADMG